MKIVSIIQARMSSTRLPGKVLLEAAGQPLLIHMLERISRCPVLDEVWVATSKEEDDDPIAEAVAHSGYSVFRGSLNNVLSRFYDIGSQTKADVIVRLTGDCPLHDPKIIDRVIDFYLTHCEEFDYVSNVLPPSYPDGLDTEVFTFQLLADAYQNATSPFDLEHVVPYIRRISKENGRRGNFAGPANFSHLRWTLDEPEDYQLIKEVYEDLYRTNHEFGWLDVLAWITQDPRRLTLNSKHERNVDTRDIDTSQFQENI